MPTLLFINACVRGKDSRTLQLAEQLLESIREENKKDMAFHIEEIRLSTENLLPLNYERLQRRDELLANGIITDTMFDYANAVAQADMLVIAAPYWDMSFPATLKIFFEAAKIANMHRISLAKLAVEETGMGVGEDKVIKNNYASEYIYNAYKNTKTGGVIEEDKSYGIKRIAEPIGVVAAVIPTTNPTSTAIFKCLLALKTRNAIIISPHPRAKNCTIEAAKIVLEAAVKAGAPEGIIGWIDVPSLELTNEVMKNSDIILATGGPEMVKAAYSSGKPALGVGAGNTPVIIDDTADVKMAVNSIIHSKTFDNGMICASEQSVIVLESIYDAVKEEFANRGCYFLNPVEKEKVRKTIIINGALNAKIVGQSAEKIASLADFFSEAFIFHIRISHNL